jgi:hypothetical protein
MRLDLLDDATRRFVLALLQTDEVNPRRRKRDAHAAPHWPSTGREERRGNPSCPGIKALADELIEKCCEPHSMGRIYEFFLKTHGSRENARAEFINFLSGQWSRDWVEAAQRVAEERRQADTVQAG